MTVRYLYLFFFFTYSGPEFILIRLLQNSASLKQWQEQNIFFFNKCNIFFYMYSMQMYSKVVTTSQ